MKTALSTFLLLGLFFNVFAQPYVDIINLRYLHNLAGDASGVDNYNISTTLPFVFKKSENAVILSPYYERWNLSIGQDYNVRGLVLPISFLKTLSPKWSIITTAIARSNKEDAYEGSAMQYGGAVIAALKHSETKTYKFGMYYNREFFGNFFMPLIGLDFKLSANDNLFGVLPGNLTFEHKVNKSFYYGGTFRAVTNAYLLYQIDPGFGPGLQDFLRIDDNQLAIYGDLYLKNNIVLNAEIGHSILRKIRKGTERDNKTTYSKSSFKSDQVFAKLSLCYRIRLKK